MGHYIARIPTENDTWYCCDYSTSSFRFIKLGLLAARKNNQEEGRRIFRESCA